MNRHPFITLIVLAAAVVAAPQIARAQTFHVDKVDIKGDGGTDYVAVEAATGRVFVSRATHMMVIEGATGKVLGDIQNTPGVHGAGIATKAGHGFTTNGGDSTVRMFDLKTLAVIKHALGHADAVGPVSNDGREQRDDEKGAPAVRTSRHRVFSMWRSVDVNCA